MFKAYRKSQDVQRQWIRNHPVQYIALNAILTVAFIGYMQHKDRKEMRDLKIETPPIIHLN